MLSPNPTVSLAFYMCSLAVCRSSHLPPLGTLTESRLGVHVGEACIALGVPVSQLGGSSCKLPGAACCQIFLMESGKWLVGSYSFDEFSDLAAVLPAFPYPSDIQITSAFCWVRKKLGYFVSNPYSLVSWKLTHTLSLSRVEEITG